MTRKLLFLTAAASMLSTAASAKLPEELRGGLNLEVAFDNREDAACHIDDSHTYFTMRITPWAGYAWDARNRVVVGADLFEDLGSARRFIDKAQLVGYYKYESEKVKALAGLFSRTDEMRGRYMPDLLGSTWSFYHNQVKGFMGQYRSSKGFVELALSWDGARDFDTREQFRVISGGERWLRHGWKLGYAAILQHFAKTYNPDATVDGLPEGVVDHIILNPYIGWSRKLGAYELTANLSLVQTLQRDRRTEQGWKNPGGGKLEIGLSRWGVTLSNELYVGTSLMPFQELYGSALYASPVFFATESGYYDRICALYGRTFYNGRLSVSAGLLFHYDGVGLGLQQLAKVSVRIGK